MKLKRGIASFKVALLLLLLLVLRLLLLLLRPRPLLVLKDNVPRLTPTTLRVLRIKIGS